MKLEHFSSFSPFNMRQVNSISFDKFNYLEQLLKRGVIYLD